MNSQISSAATDATVQKNCEIHGEYSARVLPSINGQNPITRGCPKCMAYAQEGEAAKKENAERTRMLFQAAAMLADSGIPERFLDRSFENFQAETDAKRKALDVVRKLTDSIVDGPNRGGSLVLCGNTGTGKTHLACASGHAVADAGMSVGFLTVMEAIRHVKETYRRDSERTEKQAIADHVAPDLLILDEVGVQVGSDHEKMILFEVINARYARRRSTILISNLTREELTAYLGERVMDRFNEIGAVVAFTWASYRGKARS